VLRDEEQGTGDEADGYKRHDEKEAIGRNAEVKVVDQGDKDRKSDAPPEHREGESQKDPAQSASVGEESNEGAGGPGRNAKECDELRDSNRSLRAQASHDLYAKRGGINEDSEEKDHEPIA